MDVLTQEATEPSSLFSDSEPGEKVKFRKCIVAISGAPATGKSTLGREIANNSNCVFLDVDETRRALFGKHEQLEPERERLQMEASYNRNHRLAEAELRRGNPVILVATYSRSLYHSLLKDLAQQSGAPLKVICLTVDDKTIAERLTKRQAENSNCSNITTLNQYLGVKQRLTEVEGVPLLKIEGNIPLPRVYNKALDFLDDLRIN